MELHIAECMKKVVKIIAHNTMFDWKLPFQKKHANTTIGSGFFIDNKGHIITCSHCVQDATKVYIELPNEGNHKYDVIVKGICPKFDIALLQIIGYKNKDYFDLDNSEVKIGSETHAVGYPLGQTNMKVTRGIISGQQYGYYQTDTAINPGNSGGPIIFKGKVIGIIAAGIPLSENIGFAVPISRFFLIKSLLFDKKNKLVLYPRYLGIEDSHNITIEFRKYNKNNCELGGLYIQNVIENSSVSKSKIKQGDVICKINDISVNYEGYMNKMWLNENMTIGNILDTIGISKKVHIQYWTKNKLKSTTIKLRKDELKVREYYPVYEDIDYENIGGLIVMNINENIINELKKDKLLKYTKVKHLNEEVVILSNILKGSYVHKMNILKDGDIITRVNGKKIKNVEEFRVGLKMDKKVLRIETDDNKLCIMNVNKLKQDDRLLSKLYGYRMSKVI